MFLLKIYHAFIRGELLLTSHFNLKGDFCGQSIVNLGRNILNSKITPRKCKLWPWVVGGDINGVSEWICKLRFCPV